MLGQWCNVYQLTHWKTLEDFPADLTGWAPRHWSFLEILTCLSQTHGVFPSPARSFTTLLFTPAMHFCNAVAEKLKAQAIHKNRIWPAICNDGQKLDRRHPLLYPIPIHCANIARQLRTTSNMASWKRTLWPDCRTVFLPVCAPYGWFRRILLPLIGDPNPTHTSFSIWKQIIRFHCEIKDPHTSYRKWSTGLDRTRLSMDTPHWKKALPSQRGGCQYFLNPRKLFVSPIFPQINFTTGWCGQMLLDRGDSPERDFADWLYAVFVEGHCKTFISSVPLCLIFGFTNQEDLCSKI